MLNPPRLTSLGKGALLGWQSNNQAKEQSRQRIIKAKNKVALE